MDLPIAYIFNILTSFGFPTKKKASIHSEDYNESNKKKKITKTKTNEVNDKMK